MEHRKFKKLLDELVGEVTFTQADKVIEALRERGDGIEVQNLIEKHLRDDLKCRRCGNRHVQGWGREKNGLQRYKCMDCNKTFNPLTGTPLARMRKKEHWLAFTRSLNCSHSVRKAAKLTKVNKNTSFLWRHRLLKSQNKSKDQPLTGIAEVDEIFLLKSRKGERNLTRDARKRGGKVKKPGLSSEQVPILIARDRIGDHIDAVLPDRSEAAVRSVLEGMVSKANTLLCMDGDPALIAFAKNEGLEYELIIASHGEHVHEKVLHIQNVNAYGQRFKQWLNRFNGVATKYLPSYLGWRHWLEKGETSITPQTTLVAALD